MNRLLCSRSKITAILLASALMFACSGDTGSTGPAGAGGATGPTGPGGPPGPSGTATVPITSVDKINVAFTSVAIPAGGGAPTITMQLTDDLGFGLTGLPAPSIGFTFAQLSAGQNGGSSEWQSYPTRSSAGIPDAQATTESASSGTFVDNDDGTYTYTFVQALNDYSGGPVFSETKTHRLGVEIRTNRGGFLPYNIPHNNGAYDFVPAGGAPLETRLIVNNDACNACHDNLELHGGARFDIDYCVTCHNPYSIDGDTAAEPWGGSVDMKVMIHKIHFGVNLANGYRVVGYGGSVHDYSDIHFPQDVRNCTTCHQENDASVPEASNWRTVQNRDSCGNCHDDIDWANTGHPGGLTFTDDTLCVDCHGEDSTVNGGELRTAVAHEIPEAIAAMAFEYDVISVTDTAPGDFPTVTLRVLDPTHPDYGTDPASTAWDINDPAGPFQIGRARISVDISWSTDELGNLDPNDDLARPMDTGSPFGPMNISFSSGAVNDGNNVFSATSATAIPTGASGSGLALVEGYPYVDLGNGAQSIAVTSTGISFAITDATAQDRRQVVDIEKCNDCHNTLALHGNNRVGNTELCSTCHNPNSTDINRRVVDADCEVALGPDDEPIDMKYMIHSIHAGNTALCGYGNRPHDYTDLVYPGRLNNCEGCHLDGTYYPVDPSAVMATTIDAGDDRSTLTDDVAISPNTAVCSSCHAGNLAENHMTQNGGDFNAMKDDSGMMISSGVETCQVCHSEGASADVGDLHGVATFESN